MKRFLITMSLISLSLFIYSCDDNTTEPDKTDVFIGQVWMTKNLDVDHYRNGEKIPQVTDPVEWSKLTTGAWCYYNNDPLMGKVYGKLYNKYAIDDLRQLAPQGWHLPTIPDWQYLIDFLGGEDIAGGKLKEKSTAHWLYPNTGATDQFGFQALPGGLRQSDGTFGGINEMCYWWNIEESNFMQQLVLGAIGISFVDIKLNRSIIESRNYGFSVRCVKD